MNQQLKSGIWVVGLVASAVLLYTAYGDYWVRSSDIAYDLLQKNIEIHTSDGRQLDAALTIPVPVDTTIRRLYPAVILLSPYLESGQTYGPLPALLGRRGLIVLTVNMRYSLGADSTLVVSPEDIANLPLDGEAAIRYLQGVPQVDPRRLALLGTELSARAAVIAAGLNRDIRALVLVSATMDEKALALIREADFRPILVLVSLGDGPAGIQAREIFEASKNAHSRIESYINAGQGSDIWRAGSTVEMATLIVKWLSQELYRNMQS